MNSLIQILDKNVKLTLQKEEDCSFIDSKRFTLNETTKHEWETTCKKLL